MEVERLGAGTEGALKVNGKVFCGSGVGNSYFVLIVPIGVTGNPESHVSLEVAVKPEKGGNDK